MEIIQTDVLDSRNVMWRNYRAHSIPCYSDTVFELDFRFKRETDPVVALQKISDWHHRFEKAIEQLNEEAGLPRTVLFVCNEHEMFREYSDFNADFRGILTFACDESHFIMTEIFSSVACSGFRVSYRAIPLSVYSRVHAAQVAWLESERCAERNVVGH